MTLGNQARALLGGIRSVKAKLDTDTDDISEATEQLPKQGWAQEQKHDFCDALANQREVTGSAATCKQQETWSASTTTSHHPAADLGDGEDRLVGALLGRRQGGRYLRPARAQMRSRALDFVGIRPRIPAPRALLAHGGACQRRPRDRVNCRDEPIARQGFGALFRAQSSPS